MFVLVELEKALLRILFPDLVGTMSRSGGKQPTPR